MPGCSGLYGPRGSRTTPKPKSGYPRTRLRSSTFHSLETPQEPKMLRAQNDLNLGVSARYNRFPPRRHVRTLFIFEIEFHFTFLGPKKPKSRSQSTPFDSKNSIIFNDLLAGDSEHKSEKFFFEIY